MKRDPASRRLVRPLLRCFVGTSLAPNHLTLLRLVVALAACGAFAVGEPTYNIAGGCLWALAVLLDYADGEFARLSGKASPLGKRLDYWSDLVANSLVFVAIGLGLRQGWLGFAALPLGAIAAIGVLVAMMLAERADRRSSQSATLLAERFGFDLDEAMYAIALAAWLGLLIPLLVGAALGGPVAALLILGRLCRSP